MFEYRTVNGCENTSVRVASQGPVPVFVYGLTEDLVLADILHINCDRFADKWTVVGMADVRDDFLDLKNIYVCDTENQAKEYMQSCLEMKIYE